MTASVTIAFAVWMLLICIGLLAYQRFSAARQADLLLQTTAEGFRHDLADTTNADGTDQPDPRMPATGLPIDFMDEHREDLIANHLALTIVDAHGHVLQRSETDAPPWPLPRNDEWRIITMSAGKTTLVLGFHWSKTEETQHQQALLLFTLSLCVVMASALGAWVLVGRTLSPISRLSRQALEATTDSLRLRLASPSQDAEMVELVSTLNDLLSRLAGTAAAKGRFYAAASHELRTPLQALSGHLEVALTRERTAAEYHDTLVEARNQTRRLISLVQDLLLLNQLDAASAPPAPAAVTVADIVERTLASLQSIVAQRKLDIQVETLAEEDILAPPTHLEMLVRNIIENAVKYAVPAGAVRIALQHEKRGLTLIVFNTFPTEPQLNAENLFEPFYRHEIAHTARNGGNGLGLAICKAITLVNGWSIDFRQDSDGVRVTTVF